jgi:hypothetical protein
MALRGLLGSEEEWAERLALAIRARLPVLAGEVLPTITQCLRQDGGKALRVLCSLPNDPPHSHVIGRVLEAWEPSRKLAEAIVAHLLRSLAERTTIATILDRLAADAPCAAVAVLALGLQPVARQERDTVLAAVVRRLLPAELRESLAGSPARHLAAAAEEPLLEKAISASRCDRLFLVGKDVGIAARAWASAANVTPYLPNLATALTVAAIRKWLTVHMISKLRDRLC